MDGKCVGEWWLDNSPRARPNQSVGTKNARHAGSCAIARSGKGVTNLSRPKVYCGECPLESKTDVLCLGATCVVVFSGALSLFCPIFRHSLTPPVSTWYIPMKISAEQMIRVLMQTFPPFSTRCKLLRSTYDEVLQGPNAMS